MWFDVSKDNGFAIEASQKIRLQYYWIRFISNLLSETFHYNNCYEEAKLVVNEDDNYEYGLAIKFELEVLI